MAAQMDQIAWWACCHSNMFWYSLSHYVYHIIDGHTTRPSQQSHSDRFYTLPGSREGVYISIVRAWRSCRGECRGCHLDDQALRSKPSVLHVGKVSSACPPYILMINQLCTLSTTDTNSLTHPDWANVGRGQHSFDHRLVGIFHTSWKATSSWSCEAGSPVATSYPLSWCNQCWLWCIPTRVVSSPYIRGRKKSEPISMSTSMFIVSNYNWSDFDWFLCNQDMCVLSQLEHGTPSQDYLNDVHPEVISRYYGVEGSPLWHHPGEMGAGHYDINSDSESQVSDDSNNSSSESTSSGTVAHLPTPTQNSQSVGWTQTAWWVQTRTTWQTQTWTTWTTQVCRIL